MGCSLDGMEVKKGVMERVGGDPEPAHGGVFSGKQT